jgi:aspartyl/asparaginyl beta-hydroxylase (cupin superfamily)
MRPNGIVKSSSRRPDNGELCGNLERGKNTWICRREQLMSLTHPNGNPHFDQANGADRFHEYLRSFASNEGVAHGFYPGLEARPFSDGAHFPIVHDLESEFQTIRSEILSLDQEVFHPEAEKVHRTGSWDVFMLFERGKKNHENCSRCPAITEIIEANRTVRDMMGLSYVSRMSPGTKIAAHRGPTNLRLRCHLGIAIPEGDCGLRVDTQIGRWEAGKCLVFDDFLEHESWNFSQSSRTVLIIDLWHPDLTEIEVELLSGLHAYTALQAANLHNYWLANAKARGSRRVSFD